MSVSTFTKTGNKATTPAKLPKDIFDVEVKNHDLIQQAYDMYLSNGRSAHAKTKTRGEVRGGGRKPWRQKGTGRARFGSSRVPIWRGGGITFGPTGEQNYTQALPLNAKRRALRQALSLAKASDKISVIETFDCKDGKTSDTAKLLKKLSAERNVLLVVSLKDDLVVRATANIANLIVTQAKYLNVYDILNADRIVLSQKSVEMISEWLSPAAEATEKKI